MLYLICGEEYLVEKQINDIVKSLNVSDVSKYDLDAYNYKDVLEDATSFSMFGEDKCIVIYNALIFTSNKTMVPAEPFIEYINNPNPNTTLIFVSVLSTSAILLAETNAHGKITSTKTSIINDITSCAA